MKTDLSNLFDFGNEMKLTDIPEKSGQIVLNKSGIEVQLTVTSPFINNEASLRFVSTNNNPLPIENCNSLIKYITNCILDRRADANFYD